MRPREGLTDLLSPNDHRPKAIVQIEHDSLDPFLVLSSDRIQ